MSDLITKRDPVQIALEIVDGTRGPQGLDDDPFKHLKVLADEVLRLRKEPTFREVMEWAYGPSFNSRVLKAYNKAKSQS